jgi:hypothetical protein
MATIEEKLSEKKLPRVIIGGEDCKRLKAEVVGMRRALRSIELNAKQFGDKADALIKLFDDLETELSEP